MLHAEVPLFRLDIEREADLIEEVGRIFGYENIEHKMPTAALHPPERNIKNYWLRQLRRHLSTAGFNEVYNYSFVSEEDLDLWEFDKKDAWELRNPASQDLKFMRPSLLPGMLKTIKENLKYYDEASVFEAGDIFKKKQQIEQTRLSIAFSAKGANGESFYILKGEIEHLLHVIGISDVWFDDSLKPAEGKELSCMHPRRTAFIKTGDKQIGFMGQVHPRISDSKKLKAPVFIADIDTTILIEEAEEEEIYSPSSEYPRVIRDIAVIIPRDVKAESVIEKISTAGGELLRDVDMFDYYEETENIDNKSMAFHLIFQAEDRTLESEEVDEIMGKIEKEINNKGWEVK